MRNKTQVSALNLFLDPDNKDIHLLTFEKCSSQMANDLRKFCPEQAEFFSSFRLCDDLIYAIADESLHILRKFFRDIEVLVIEDLKDLKNKTATQIFVRELLISRRINGKKTVILSEKRLKKKSFLSKKLKTTLESGLVIN